MGQKIIGGISHFIGPKRSRSACRVDTPAQAGEDDGYSGRIGIHEVLTMNRTIKELIMKGGTSDEIETQARKEGMLTMIEDGILKSGPGDN